VSIRRRGVGLIFGDDRDRGHRVEGVEVRPQYNDNKSTTGPTADCGYVERKEKPAHGKGRWLKKEGGNLLRGIPPPKPTIIAKGFMNATKKPRIGGA
jgi:hypothetical protein